MDRHHDDYGSIHQSKAMDGHPPVELGGPERSSSTSASCTNDRASSGALSAWALLAGVLCMVSLLGTSMDASWYKDVIGHGHGSNSQEEALDGGLLSTNFNQHHDEHDHRHDHADSSHSSAASWWRPHDPAQALFFEGQLIDHNHPSKGTFRQRFYAHNAHYRGPGHPIFFIFGGEGALQGILYPFVSETLAQRFGAITFNLEHRYFGVSYPVQKWTPHDIAEQLTPRQALQDMVRFIHAMQVELGCGPRGSTTYCPVLTVGASYSGLLSTLIRLSYPNVVDMAYAGGPCLKLFDHSMPSETYYDYITQVAQRMSPGCPQAVQGALAEAGHMAENWTKAELHARAPDFGFCALSHKDEKQYGLHSGKDLAQLLADFTSNHFGDTNMDNYPPGPHHLFYLGCVIFQNTSMTVPQRFRAYVQLIVGNDENSTLCYNLHPPDVRTSQQGAEDYMWDALSCFLVPMISRGPNSMWPAQSYRKEDDVKQCRRKGIAVNVKYMDEEFGLDKLFTSGKVNRLLLTNGRNDGWFPLSYTEPPQNANNNSGIVIMNFENGAHHSELMHRYPIPNDTPDIVRGHKEIANLIELWIRQVQAEAA